MRIVTRQYLIELLDEYYKQQQNFCFFCNQRKCTFCQKTHFFEEELRNRRFNTSNSHVLIWNITYMRKNMNIVCLRSVSKNMSEELVIKYNVAND